MPFAVVHRALVKAAVAFVVATALVGCGGVRDQLGLTKKPPDEFTVVSKPPLVIPPNFNLRPPLTGTTATGEPQPTDIAQAALLANQNAGTQANNTAINHADRSSGELAILRMAGASNADPTIREIVLRETTLLEEKDKSFTNRLIFWQKTQPAGQVVDAKAEAQRLQENAATGLPPTAGETPVIERRKRAILEGIF